MIQTKTATFHFDIMKLIEEKKMNFIDAAIHWGELNNFEPEQVAELIKKNQVIMAKITQEAEDLSLIKEKRPMLPVCIGEFDDAI